VNCLRPQSRVSRFLVRNFANLFGTYLIELIILPYRERGFCAIWVTSVPVDSHSGLAEVSHGKMEVTSRRNTVYKMLSGGANNGVRQVGHDASAGRECFQIITGICY
jgi:hypothetical protein